MTPKELAQHLLDKYWSVKWGTLKSVKSYRLVGMPRDAAKQCALMAVNEVIFLGQTGSINTELYKYYLEVKKELELL